MFECRWTQRVERWFDGESREPEAVEQHLAQCPACTAMVARMGRLRDGIRARVVRPEIAQAQVPAFLDGIRDRLETPAPRRTGMWALVSLSTAALVVAVSVFSMFTGPEVVKAHTEVESATTEVEGATVKTQDSTEDSPAIVWVHVPRRDVL